jgi:hypothetical protein
MRYSSIKHPDSVLDILISEIFHSSPDLRVSKNIIYKILYDLKNQLDADNPVKDALPFYWYFYGPNSDYIKEHISKMENRGIIDLQKLPDGRPLLHLRRDVSTIDDTGLDEAHAKLHTILEGFDISKAGDYRESIYRHYAPFSFQNTFKYDYLKQLKSFNSKIQLRIILEDNENDAEIQKEFSRLESLLYTCETELSVHSVFEDFQEKFSSFVTGTLRILETNAEVSDFNKFNLGKETLDFLNDSTWNTFARGVRIPGEGHDPVYEDKVPEWCQIFEQALSGYENIIDDYDAQSIDFISLNRLRSRILDKQSKSILSSSICGYLGYGE